MESVFTRFHQTFGRKLEQPVREHMTLVYGSLALSTLTAALGTYLHISTDYFASSGLHLLSALAGIGLVLAINFTPHNEKNVLLRMGYFLGFSLFSGLSMGPLVEYTLHLNPSILLTALFSSFFIFGSFSLAAIYAKRGSYLFLGGPLASLLSILFWVSLSNIFFGSKLLFQFNLYAGLALFCGYIVYDTSIIIEKRRIGDKDFIMHSLLLYTDLAAVFRRILIILSQKEEEEQRRRRKD